jgi:hypothetical protein
VIEPLAKILKISADVLYFYARRMLGDLMRDFDQCSIEAAYRSFRNTLKESCTAGQSHAQPGYDVAQVHGVAHTQAGAHRKSIWQ